MRKFKMTKRMMTLGIASVGLIGATAVIAPLLTSCSKVTELTLSKTTFSLNDGNSQTTYIAKGRSNKWFDIYLYNADKQIKTISDLNKVIGYKDKNDEDVPGTCCMKAYLADHGSLEFNFDFFESKSPEKGDYTLYGLGMNINQYCKFHSMPMDENNPNYNKDAKLPGTLISCKITIQ